MVVSLWALLIGFIIDLIIGDPRSIPHPIIFIGNTISKTEKILRKLFNKTEKQERFAGFLLVLIVVPLSSIIPLLILEISDEISVYLRLAVESIMCWQILATKCLKDESMKVYYSLKEKDLEKSRFNVSMIVGRDTKSLDKEGIIKATVETIAENTSDGVIAPMLYIAIGGPVLGFFYKSINTMDSMVGYKNDKYINFGKSAAILDDIVNFIPARLSAFFMIISSFVLNLNYKNAIKIYKRDKRRHASPNSAQTESVCAGALGIKLAGDAIYHGKLYKKEYIGDELKPIEADDIKTTNTLMITTSITAMIIISMIAYVMYFAIN